MTPLEKAKEILESGGYTCVLCSDNAISTDVRKGIVPLLERAEGDYDFKGFGGADIIVGKAAAMLFAYMGIASVYGKVMSRAADDFLTAKGIPHSFGTLADMIENRSGTGVCPMEETVMDINDPEEAVTALRKTLDRLRNS